jgi:hypothetical protein
VDSAASLRGTREPEPVGGNARQPGLASPDRCRKVVDTDLLTAHRLDGAPNPYSGTRVPNDEAPVGNCRPGPRGSTSEGQLRKPPSRNEGLARHAICEHGSAARTRRRERKSDATSFATR